MVPSIGSARLIRAYAGVRPLFSQTRFENDRQVSRGFIILDHEERDGIEGLISIVGGKMATYRLMAEKTVDLVCQKLGVARGCTTHTEPLPASRKERFIGMKERLKKTVPENRKDERDQIICECELVTRREIEEAVMMTGDGDLNDIRVLTRMGTGPCQGTLCAYKTLGILAEMDRLSGSSSNKILKDFLERRWRGIRPVVQNDQLREEELTAAIYGGVFNLDKEDLSLNKTMGEQEDLEKPERSK